MSTNFEMSEDQLRAAFVHYFSPYFEIMHEVTAHYINRRIDLVLIDKRNRNYVYGIELKNPAHKRGNDLAAWVTQAAEYSRIEFNINGRISLIPVFIYPAISSMFMQIDYEVEPVEVDGVKYYKPYHRINSTHQNIGTVINEFGIGEVRKIQYGAKPEHYAFMFKNNIIWQEFGRTHENNFQKYFPKHLTNPN